MLGVERSQFDVGGGFGIRLALVIHRLCSSVLRGCSSDSSTHCLLGALGTRGTWVMDWNDWKKYLKTAPPWVALGCAALLIFLQAGWTQFSGGFWKGAGVNELGQQVGKQVAKPGPPSSDLPTGSIPKPPADKAEAARKAAEKAACERERARSRREDDEAIGRAERDHKNCLDKAKWAIFDPRPASQICDMESRIVMAQKARRGASDNWRC
jgi:hypothetical protein